MNYNGRFNKILIEERKEIQNLGLLCIVDVKTQFAVQLHGS